MPKPTKTDLDFCRETLPKVSRTFALVIAILKGDLYKSVLLAYLLCRIADTIEDNSFMTPEKKYELLDQFLDALTKKGDWQEPVKNIQVAFLDHRQENPDYSLTFNSDIVFRVFDTLNDDSRACVVPWIVEMVTGMKKFQAFSTPSEKITAVKDLPELENYCYYVAGTVGKMLTELFILHSCSISEKNKAILNQFSVSFGIGLQMTNILKDINDDLKRGWCYIPRDLLDKYKLTPESFKENINGESSRNVVKELRLVARNHLKNALIYTFALPKTERSMRLFCLWPLHMANLTLHALHDQSELYIGKTIKISRRQVKNVIMRTSFDWFSNRRQETYFNSFSF